MPVSKSDRMKLSERFDDAVAYANRVHGNQRRKGSEVPYLSHLLAVASLVLEYGGDEDEAIAALLHDAPEDRGGSPVLEEFASVSAIGSPVSSKAAPIRWSRIRDRRSRGSFARSAITSICAKRATHPCSS